ncbi:DUF2637 domain-containing protein [Streptomyces sp. NBC_00435]|uniref:DUF2637 domain-containing protein n=1 Tax=Streptomyces sp. NBC_00435 TaxID=2903649 RepID=UPI002E21994D
MAAMQLTRTHRILIGVVVAGAVVIAGIGFAGSYAAVRALAVQKGFGTFSLVFPIGIDMGICVLLALDLLLTWIRIPFPLLRQTAWLLTAATIAFNGAAAWPDPLGVGMHAVIPILFVVTVEAARHAVGRIADITADRHMEGVRITRWLLSPLPTFKLWRRMKLWELRSYEQAVGMEQDRLIYQARLQARYGRFWRRKAPVGALMPLRLARIGVPLSQTAPEGLAAAGIDPLLLPPADPTTHPALPPGSTAALHTSAQNPAAPALAGAAGPHVLPAQGQPQAGVAPAGPQAQMEAQAQAQLQAQAFGPAGEPLPAGTAAQQAAFAAAAAATAGPGPHGPVPQGHQNAAAEPPFWDAADGGAAPQGHPDAAPFVVDPTAMPAAHNSAWFAAPRAPQAAYEGGYNPQYVEGLEPTPVMPPTGLEEQDPDQRQELPVPAPRQDGAPPEDAPSADEDEKFAEAAYEVFRSHLEENGEVLTAEQLDIVLADRYGVVHPRSASLIRKIFPQLKQRYQTELENEHIA